MHPISVHNIIVVGAFAAVAVAVINTLVDVKMVQNDGKRCCAVYVSAD